MDICVTTSKVNDTKDEEPLVTDFPLMKALGYFKLFQCSKQLFKNLDAMYERAGMANSKDKYGTEMYDTITI